MVGGRLTKGIKYSVVGRYMTGSTVTGYHLVGDDGSQVQVTKNQLIRLVDQGVIGNCRVQMYNDNPLLRGKGINLNSLPVYDEKNQSLKRTENLGGVKPKTSDPNAVFGQLLIKGRIMHGNTCIGYIVQNAGGVEKRLSRAKVIEMATERQIGNARIQKNNDKILLRGVGVSLDKLPVIYVDKTGKEITKEELEEAKVAEQKVAERAAKELRPVQAKPPVSDKVKTPQIIDVLTSDIAELGKTKDMVLNRDLTVRMPELNRPVGIPEVKAGTARLYMQVYMQDSISNIDEFVTTNVKFGKERGIVMRVVNRRTKEVTDIREKTLGLGQISEKIALGIMCCGIMKKYKPWGFGLLSIQSNDAKYERAYEM